MPFFVAPGRAVSSPRGNIAGGSANSEVSSETFCRDPNSPRKVADSKVAFKRLIEIGVVIECDEAPTTPEAEARADRLRQMTQTQDLSRPTPTGEPILNIKERAERTRSRMRQPDQASTVSLRPETLTEGELADLAAEQAIEAQVAADVAKVNAENAAEAARLRSEKEVSDAADDAARDADAEGELGDSDSGVSQASSSGAPVGAQVAASPEAPQGAGGPISPTPEVSGDPLNPKVD